MSGTDIVLFITGLGACFGLGAALAARGPEREEVGCLGVIFFVVFGGIAVAIILTQHLAWVP